MGKDPLRYFFHIGDRIVEYPAECVETLRKAALGQASATPLEVFLCALSILTYLSYSIVRHPANIIFGSTDSEFVDQRIAEDMSRLALVFGVEPPVQTTSTDGAMAAFPLSGPLQDWFITRIVPVIVDRLLTDEFLKAQLEQIAAYIRDQIENFFEKE